MTKDSHLHPATMIDFTLSPSQKELQQVARTFTRNDLRNAQATYNEHPTQIARFRSTRPLYQAAVTAGLLRCQIPTHFGGTGEGLVDMAIVVEELYATEPSVTLTVLGTGLGLTPLILAGNEEQKARLLAPFLNGEGEPLARLVHSEPGGTANWLEKGSQGLQTTARREGDKWIINGEKVLGDIFLNFHIREANTSQFWTTNSGGWDNRGADLQCVVCSFSDTPGSPQDPDVDPHLSSSF